MRIGTNNLFLEDSPESSGQKALSSRFTVSAFPCRNLEGVYAEMSSTPSILEIEQFSGRIRGTLTLEENRLIVTGEVSSDEIVKFQLSERDGGSSTPAVAVREGRNLRLYIGAMAPDTDNAEPGILFVKMPSIPANYVLNSLESR